MYYTSCRYIFNFYDLGINLKFFCVSELLADHTHSLNQLNESSVFLRKFKDLGF